MTDLRLDTADSLAWQAERNSAATSLLRTLPAFEPFQQAMLASPDAGSRAPVVRRGGRWFQRRLLDPMAEHAVVTVRSSLTADPRILVDPNEIQAKRGTPVQLVWSVPSPDGAVLAYGISEAGTEVVEVTLLDVATGSPLPDEVPWSVVLPPAWLPDSSGFWCTGRVVDASGMRMPLYRYLLGRPAPDTPVGLPEGLLFPRPQVSPDGRYVGIVSGNSEPRLDYVVQPDGSVAPLLAGVEGSVLGRFAGDHVVAIVTGDAPRGRLVRIPLATPTDRSTWVELVPESADVLCWLEVLDDHLVLGSLRDAASHVRVLTLDGEHLRNVGLPPVGSVGTIDVGLAALVVPMFEVGEGEISFLYSDFATSSTVYRYEVAADLLEIVDPPAVTLDGLVVTTLEAVSADGTAVPAHVVHRADLDLSTSHPTLVTGYGGFGLSLLPSYLGNLAPWVQAGGIYVVSHLRGGGEKGTGWWRDGSRENKQHTFDDLYAVAERLVELGLTTSSQLAMYGESNGGLLAGVAVAQRPDLWAAVVPDVPLLDLLEMHRDPIGYAICRGEYGDPLVPEEAAWLRTYSPCELVRPSTFPATLVIAGANDPRCAAWHSRVFVQKLADCQRGDAPVLLRVHSGQGHGAAGTRARAERTAEWLAFCAQHTGLQADAEVAFADVIGGVVVSDPFRWLEHDEDAAVLEWQRLANDQTVKELAHSPHRRSVEDVVRATFADMWNFAAPGHFGEHWFRLSLASDGMTRVLQVSAAADSSGRVLVDPTDYGSEAALTHWKPSPDGTMVVFATGSPVAHFRVMQVSDGQILQDLGERVIALPVEWAADGSGLYYQEFAVTVGDDGAVGSETQIWWQPLRGERVRQQVELDHPVAWPLVDRDGNWVAVTADQTGPRPRWISRAGSGEWTRFLPDATASYKGTFVGDDFWAITDDESGWCRLVAIPVETSEDRSTWRVLVSAAEGTKLASITRCGEFVALTVIQSGVMRMHSLTTDGSMLGEVDLPGDGAYGTFAMGYALSGISDVVIPDGDGCTFVFSTLSSGPGVYRADLRTRTLTVLQEPQHALSARINEAYSIEGPNGPVTYRVMRKAETPLDGSAPVIATGYGGFNIPWLPSYSSAAAAWTELGGVWVHSHLRGGGEGDDAFRQAGRMQRKQGTFDDFHAVIADLQSRGFAVPQRTGVWGSSNGGLLVGAAFTQFPELLRAVVAEVPPLDLMQCRKDPVAMNAFGADYGNPDDPEHAPFMHSYSPYHRVREGISYPALLCDAGALDSTCPPWHSRKMVAAVTHASTSQHRTMLRVREGVGHNQMRTSEFMERDIEQLTFFKDELTN